MLPEQGCCLPTDCLFTLKTGYEWDDVFNARLAIKKELPHFYRNVNSYSQTNHWGVITCGFNDRVELYGALGNTSLHIEQKPFSNLHLKYGTSEAFSWQIGGRVLLAYWSNFHLGIDAKYFKSNPKIKKISINEEAISLHRATFDSEQWQVGLGVSHRFNYWAPYIGVKYSNIWGKFKYGDVLKLSPWGHSMNFENRFPLGLFVGCGFFLQRGLNINIEGRWVNETAMTVSGDFRF